MGEELCDTTLALAIGHGSLKTKKCLLRESEPPKVRLHLWFPSSCGKEEEEEEEEEEKLLLLESENSENPQERKRKSEQDDRKHGSRKKLRLSSEQTALLEDSFRAHNTLNSIEKEDLAFRLSLRPRQVEVWFQNRRARTKLKQTEVDCEFLKGWCETLSDENRRLRTEVQELKRYAKRSMAEGMSFCSSCEGLMTGEEMGSAIVPGKKKARNLQFCS